MATVPDLTYDGVLDADGTIHLDHPPEMPPGRVQVTLRPVSGSAASEVLLVEDPCGGGYIPTPCDLPLPGPFKRIYPQRVEAPLPDPLILDDE